jgi:glycine dehydrogenase
VSTAAKGTTARHVLDAAVKQGINLRPIDDTTVGIAFDETTERRHVVALLAAFGAEAQAAKLDALASAAAPLSSAVVRSDAILSHPVFNTHRSETQLLRYIHKLQAKVRTGWVWGMALASPHPPPSSSTLCDRLSGRRTCR